MSTLFVSHSTVLGGAERLLLDAAEGLDEPPALACPEGPLAEAARAASLRVWPVRRRSVELRRSGRDRAAAGVRLAGLALEIRSLTRSLRPRVVFAWGMRALLACVPALGRAPGRPALVFQHNDLLPGPLIGAAVRRAAGQADRVVCLSSSVAADLGPTPQPPVVIHPGVDLERFSPAGPPRRPLVVTVGAIVGWKRPLLALEAAAAAAQRLPGLELELVGGTVDAAGPALLAELERRAGEPDLAGRTRMPGRTSDIASVLSEAACLLHCADLEPFGIALVEALASGVPVVAPAAAGPTEIVDDSCGRLYPPGDVEAAAAALLEVLDSPERHGELAAGARARAVHSFDRRETQRRYRDLLREQRPSAPVASVRPSAAPSRALAGTGLALVSVTHQSEREIASLLRSVERHLPGASVVVVDSGSSDAGVSAARAAAPEATVVALEENVGFSAANNRALAHVAEPVTALVNPDVELLDSSLADLAAAIAASTGPERILAPLLLRADGRRQASAHPEPGSAAMFLNALLPAAVLPGRLRRAAQPWRADRSRRTGWAVGACLVARTETLRRLGPFDERIFLYAEDMDLCLRAADAGVETWFCPGARVLHHEARSSAAAFGGEAVELLARQRRTVTARRRGPLRAAVDDLALLVTYADRAALKALSGRPRARERRQLQALLAARRRG